MRLLAKIAGNIGWGIAWGLAFATFLSLYVLMLSALQGSTWFENIEETAWSIIVDYYSAGALGGMVAGLLRPLLSWRIGAFFVGALVGTLVYGGIAYSMGARWTPENVSFALVTGILGGGGLGLYWSQKR
jgi:hypothetical protein